MEPSRPDSPVAKFLERNPKGGIHHFWLGVDSVDATAAGAARQGRRACSATASRSCNVQASASRSSIPKDFLGALVELEEHKP